MGNAEIIVFNSGGAKRHAPPKVSKFNGQQPVPLYL